MHFYEDSPLTGSSRVALTGEHTSFSKEVAIRAEPYFIDTTLPLESWSHEWEVNGQTVINTSQDPNVITLRGEGVGSTASIEFSLFNITQFLQRASNTFVINFKSEE